MLVSIRQAGPFPRLPVRADRPINKIYVNRSLIVLQERFDEAERGGDLSAI